MGADLPELALFRSLIELSDGMFPRFYIETASNSWIISKRIKLRI